MRDRRRGDWSVDLEERHALESSVAAAVEAHPALKLLDRRTAATDRLDYSIEAPGGRALEVELKTKRQRYRDWGDLRPDLAEGDLFILDELALRKIVEVGRYGFLLVRDVPGARWCLWTVVDLILTSKVRAERRLVKNTPTIKGKLLISLTEQSLTFDNLVPALDALLASAMDIDRSWNDIAPWPRGALAARAR